VTADDSFPRHSARTQRFTLGAPRDVTVSADGRSVAFLRSSGPEDPVTALWVLDLDTQEERCVADPRRLLADGGKLPPEERARRERARESASGLTAYATDASHAIATGALAGALVVADLRAGTAHVLDVPGPVVDPRTDPTGTRVAWVRDRALWCADIADPGAARCLAGEDDHEVRWGAAEFIAAEEMDRHRGFWWAPDGRSLLVARVDETPVERWWIADPAAPATAPVRIAYPAAGTPNALVSAWLVSVDGARTEVVWDHDGWPYLSHAGWDDHGPLITVQSRDQRRLEVRAVEADGTTTVLWADEDDAWVERAAGTPARLGDGRLVVCADRDGARRLVVDGEPVTPASLHVRSVEHGVGSHVLFTANPVDDATRLQVWRWSADGVDRLSEEDGLTTASAGGGTVVLRRTSLEAAGAIVQVVDGPLVASSAAVPATEPNVTIRHVGDRRLATALVLPTGAGDDPLPVLLDPYGGPHALRVVQGQGAYGTSQWFADQGFAVVVVDGRGTPGRGSAWERAVHRDLASTLDDQIDALHALAEQEPRLDLSRVAIRGWSFGGYLAALAVLRRPDVVHAAIAGAPVTEWRLYDTHYTERYLGDPSTDPSPYDASSLLPLAGDLERPLLIVHGLADDNVVAAHTLQLSGALLAAGRPHEVLPLTGVTHMASQEEVAENLLLLQLDFLRRALRL
jgi:dipeptidyl-peptidase-4